MKAKRDYGLNDSRSITPHEVLVSQNADWKFVSADKYLRLLHSGTIHKINFQRSPFSRFLARHLYCVAWLPVLPCSYIQHSNSSLFGYTHKSVCHLSYIRMPMMHWITIYVTMLYQTTMHLKSLCSIQRAGNKWTATIITDRRPLVFQHESWARSSA